MLMDLFYDTLPPEVRSKRRVHFHAFMVDVHKAIHASKLGGAGERDPIPEVARDLAHSASVLCFDEFQVGCVLVLGQGPCSCGYRLPILSML
jgi:protein AFG1